MGGKSSYISEKSQSQFQAQPQLQAHSQFQSPSQFKSTSQFQFRTQSFPMIYIRDKNFEGDVSLTKMKTLNAYKLELKNRSGETEHSVMLKYDMYKMESGDINNDGRTDIVLGVIKRSKFDPEKRRRIFLLQTDHNRLRPLWLGTRTCRDLVDFSVLKKGRITAIITIEKEGNNFYCTGEYCWNNFGLRLIKYTNQHISLTKADEILKNEIKN